MRRTISISALVLFVSLMSFVPVREAGASSPQRKKVGLVLSGGGAKGVAHIGVLKVLEEAGIPVDYIAGTSMGSIVGGLYALGYSPAELDSLVRTQDWVALLSDRVARTDKSFLERRQTDTYLLSFYLSDVKKLKLPSGLVEGQNVYNLLTDLTIGYHGNIDFMRDLPIPFKCIAADVVTGDEVVISSGNLPMAIRASMSIPGAFAPVERDSMVLVDGGIYNNFPVDVVRDMGAEIIIGVDVTAPPAAAGEINSVIGILDQITTLTGQEKYRRNIESGMDLYMHPDIVPYTAASFSKDAIDTLLMRGEAVARENWDEILKLKEAIGIADDESLVPEHSGVHNGNIMIGRVDIEGARSELEEKLVRRTMKIADTSAVTSEQLQQAIDRVRGMGYYSSVSYKLTGDSPFDLTIQVRPRGDRAIRVGLRYDTEEGASILLNTDLRLTGSISLDITGRLSSNPYVRTTFSFGKTPFGRLNVSYMFRYSELSVFDERRKTLNTTYDRHLARVEFAGSQHRNLNLRGGLEFDYYNFRNTLLSLSPVPEPRSHGYLDYFLSLTQESFDNYYYPTRGLRLYAQYKLVTDNGLKLGDDNPVSLLSVHFDSAVSFGAKRRFTIMPAVGGRVILGSHVPYIYRNFIGGEYAGRYLSQQMAFSGCPDMELVKNSVVTAALDLRYNVFKRHYVVWRNNMALSEDHFLKLLHSDANFFWGSCAGWSFDSPVGPIELVTGYSTKSRNWNVFFSFGKYF